MFQAPSRFNGKKRDRSRNNMPRSARTHLLTTTIRSYIVHLLSTYASGTIRRNCSPWITRPAGFASSLDAQRIALSLGSASLSLLVSRRERIHSLGGNEAVISERSISRRNSGGSARSHRCRAGERGQNDCTFYFAPLASSSPSLLFLYVATAHRTDIILDT